MTIRNTVDFLAKLLRWFLITVGAVSLLIVFTFTFLVPYSANYIVYITGPEKELTFQIPLDSITSNLFPSYTMAYFADIDGWPASTFLYCDVPLVSVFNCSGIAAGSRRENQRVSADFNYCTFTPGTVAILVETLPEHSSLQLIDCQIGMTLEEQQEQVRKAAERNVRLWFYDCE